MNNIKLKKIETGKEMDLYQVNVKMTNGQLFDLLPVDNNNGCNPIVSFLSSQVMNRFNNEQGNCYDSWSLKNSKEKISLKFELEIFKK